MEKLLLIATGLLLAGCTFRSPLSGPREDSDAHPKKPRDFPIEVFTESKPARPYDVIDVVSGDNLNDLKYRARRCGADAIIVQGGGALAIAWKP